MNAGKLAARAGLAVGAYAIFARPRMLHWGATKEEIEAPFPGADIIPDGERGATMATTLDAAPEKVWPWLLQMGYRRAGWYSWDLFDNFNEPSADRIHPEWQNVKVGDVLDGMGIPCFQVAALENERFFALRGSFDLMGRRFDPAHGRPRFYTDSVWAFQLKALPNEKTRLIVSGYSSGNPRWLYGTANFFFWEPAHWIMEVRQLQNLKRLTAA